MVRTQFNEGVMGTMVGMNMHQHGPQAPVVMANSDHEPVGQKIVGGVVYAKTKCGAWVRLTPKNSKNHKKGKN